MQTASGRRGDCRRGLRDRWLAENNRAQHRAGRAGARGRSARSVLRRQPAQAAWHKLSGGAVVLEFAHARRQSVHLRLVVSHRVRRAGNALSRGPLLAALWRHQLPRGDLAERQEDCRPHKDCRRLSHLRSGRHGCRETRRDQRSCRGDLRAHGEGSWNQLGRLESLPARQGHGSVGRGGSGDDGVCHAALTRGFHTFCRWRHLKA